MTAGIDLRPGTESEAGERIGAAWESLRGRAEEAFSRSGIPLEDVTLSARVRMQYAGQLNDLEVEAAPGSMTSTAVSVDTASLIQRFEELYARVFARGASSPELGYTVTSVVLEASAPIEKPVLPSEEDREHSPDPVTERPVWWVESGDFVSSEVHLQDELGAGATITGPAIVESPSTTLAIPPGRRVHLDSNRIFHMSDD